MARGYLFLVFSFLQEGENLTNELRKTVNAAGVKAQYDACVKRLLGQKEILAQILVHCVDEFKGMSPKKVMAYIEGEPYIGSVPYEPGLTNAAAQHGGCRIVGINTESVEINEGLVRFDIVFYVHAPNGQAELAKIIVNIEAQKDEPTTYAILNSRMPEYNAEYQLHYLLSTLLSQELTSDEKLEIIETRYDIPIDDDVRKEVGEMCNLSEGIEERAIEKGVAKGIAEGEAAIIINMHNNGLSAEQIASFTNKDIHEVERIIENATSHTHKN